MRFEEDEFGGGHSFRRWVFRVCEGEVSFEGGDQENEEENEGHWVFRVCEGEVSFSV